MSGALDLLRRVFGYDAFRGHQQAAVEAVAAGEDALVLMPTGAGKSICYQLPALLRPGAGVVVSPLIALMQDQVAALRQNGVRAAAWNSTLDGRERGRIEQALREGRLELLYVAPERFAAPGFLDFLDGVEIALFAIDEAHCVSQWGHDFRPDYRRLAVLAERFPGVPRIALTATADEPTRADIARELRLEGARRFVSGFDRPNIRYVVKPRDRGPRQLLDFLKARPGQAGIVYAMTRARVEAAAAELRAADIPALAYHAGMDAAERAANQAALRRGRRCGDGGDGRLRHGHRQAGCALRRPYRPAEEPRSLLPGDRAGRARRAAGRGLDDLGAAGCRAAPGVRGPIRSLRRAEAHRARPAGCAGRLCRGRDLPAAHHARLFRRR